MRILIFSSVLWLVFCPSAWAEVGPAPHNLSPRQVIEEVVQANENRDYEGMARLMAHDDGIVNYTIAGRKYVGWAELEKDLKEEFQTVERLEIPIRELKLWVNEEKGYAWFSMEIDYIRFIGKGKKQIKHTLPLRETGVLEKRNGEWILVSWHESERAMLATSQAGKGSNDFTLAHLKGQWLIEEEDRFYCAVLDQKGNGKYSWQGGQITTQEFNGRNWFGAWNQPGNDRDGGFEIALSSNGNEARGVWWYERVRQSNIPPRRSGGSYHWTRMKSGSQCTK
jgi:hypothetical protein